MRMINLNVRPLLHWLPNYSNFILILLFQVFNRDEPEREKLVHVTVKVSDCICGWVRWLWVVVFVVVKCDCEMWLWVPLSGICGCVRILRVVVLVVVVDALGIWLHKEFKKFFLPEMFCKPFFMFLMWCIKSVNYMAWNFPHAISFFVQTSTSGYCKQEKFNNEKFFLPRDRTEEMRKPLFVPKPPQKF